MEVEEIIKSVEESFKNEKCKEARLVGKKGSVLNLLSVQKVFYKNYETFLSGVYNSNIYYEQLTIENNQN